MCQLIQQPLVTHNFEASDSRKKVDYSSFQFGAAVGLARNLRLRSACPLAPPMPGHSSVTTSLPMHKIALKLLASALDSSDIMSLIWLLVHHLPIAITQIFTYLWPGPGRHSAKTGK